MACKKQQYNYLGVIWVEKLGNDIMKDLKDIGTKLMCVFLQLFPSWKQFVAKWLNKYNTKSLRMAKSREFLKSCCTTLWEFMTIRLGKKRTIKKDVT